MVCVFFEFCCDGQAPQSSSVTSVAPDQAKQNLVTFVQPEYPSLAKAARIVGIVHAEIVIDEVGSVQSVQLISGHPLLAPSALAAIKKWKYRPFEVDGKAFAIRTEVQLSIPKNTSQYDIDAERKFQDTYWENERAGRSALETGDVATAEAKLRIARAAAEERGDQKWLELADVVSLLAGAKQRENDYPQAESLFKDSLAIHLKHQRPDEAEIASVQFNLAFLYFRMQRFLEAEPLFLEAAKTWESRISEAPMADARLAMVVILL